MYKAERGWYDVANDGVYAGNYQAREVTTMERFYRRRGIVQAMCFTTNNEGHSPTMDAIVNWVNQGRERCGAWHNGTNIFIRHDWQWLEADVGDFIVREGATYRVFRAAEFHKLFEELPVSPSARGVL